MKALALLLFGSVLWTAAGAQVGLVADLRPGGSSTPSSLTYYQNQLCFVADDGTHGMELYRFDGQNSPVRITDFNGSGNGVSGYDGILGVIDNRLFFAASNGVNGQELYAYSLAAGTVQLVSDIEAGGGDSKPYYFASISNLLYFTAQTAANGRELYTYDPATNAVTLHDIAPGAASSEPGPMVQFGTRIYFTAGATATGRELYYYDPATNSAGLAADVNPGASGSAPLTLIAFASKLYFTATTTAHGRELYEFDGTAATRLTDITPNAGDGIQSVLNNLVIYNGKLYFPGSTLGNSYYDYSLMSYDITNGQRKVVFGSNGQLPRAPANFVQHGGLLYFSAYDTANGAELRYLESDTVSKLAADINPGPQDSYPMQLTSFNGKLFFRATVPATGTELYGFPYINTAVPQAVSKSGIRAFPNPARQELQLAFEPLRAGRMSVEITDMAGKLALLQVFDAVPGAVQKISLSVAALQPGRYAYRLVQINGQAREAGLFNKE